MKPIYIIALFIILLSGCSTTHTSKESIIAAKPILSLAQKEVWKNMIGKWHGSQPTKDGGVRKQIIERSSNGAYKVIFRVYDKQNSYQEQVEVGDWGVSGTVYFTIFRGWLKGDQFAPSDPSNPYNYDAYKIVRLTNEIFEYESHGSVNKYVLKKVKPDFKFID